MSIRGLLSSALARMALLIAVLLLQGCAAQRAYEAGRELIEQGKTRDGLTLLEEALRHQPRNLQFRLAHLQARETLIARLFDQAQAAIARRDYDAAVALFTELIAVDRDNARARSGLIEVRDRRQHDRLLEQAQAARDAGDPELALAKARELLARYPDDAAAKAIAMEVEAQLAATSAAPALSASYRKPITLEFKDTPLKAVFEVLSRSSGLNFIFDRDVKGDGKTSIFLRNSTVEKAIELILLTNQLDQRVMDDNTVLIYPNTPAKQKEYQPLSVRSFYLSNAAAKDVANTLKSILKTRDVVVDDTLNLVIMRDSPQAIRLAEKLVSLHDVAGPEVMLEVEVLEINRGRLIELGVRWPDQLSLSPLAADGKTLTLEELRRIDQSSTAATVTPAVITAHEQDSRANILANPRIRARNREKAKILIGERVPNITATATSTGFVSESVTYVDVGLKLNVEPTIYPNDEVAIEIDLEVSNIISQLQTKSGSLAFRIGTRTASTVLRLKDGENQVLAGLINDEDRRTADGVPGLARLPLLGRLFRSQSNDRNKTEIVLSITPRIVRNMQRPPAIAAEFDSGTESSLGSSGGGTVSGSSEIASSTRPRDAGLGDERAPRKPAADDDTAVHQESLQRSIGNTTGTIGGGVSPGNGSRAATLRWQGPDSLAQGDSFTLQLLMQSEAPIVSIPLAVGFDPAVLQLTSVAEGDFLRQGNAQTSFSSRVDPGGQAILTATRAGDSGATSVGAVATFSFKIIGSGETRVQLLAISPIAFGGGAVSAPLPVPHVVSITP